ncbi:uncharacterized protein MYCFIDRAFT_170977 [Pseudocercospora fijiensis CIRAD86]|uniref:Uncharacterized protein n=1 Tax=Pseudocercospora fijiensis (strain CIRAD86) TaxID=383855 RepID=N1QBL0_PSEFD|nr:uncharacterized protein MYCFIDRAFT_170977 [Pseudocercospora fijiensis CIRAD86]EME89531.1 hypothetical protein MYCFIDRAFT_170977 [Pseudocercospora fijiensis CIRAD86]
MTFLSSVPSVHGLGLQLQSAGGTDTRLSARPHARSYPKPLFLAPSTSARVHGCSSSLRCDNLIPFRPTNQTFQPRPQPRFSLLSPKIELVQRSAILPQRLAAEISTCLSPRVQAHQDHTFAATRPTCTRRRRVLEIHERTAFLLAAFRTWSHAGDFQFRQCDVVVADTLALTLVGALLEAGDDEGPAHFGEVLEAKKGLGEVKVKCDETANHLMQQTAPFHSIRQTYPRRRGTDMSLLEIFDTMSVGGAFEPSLKFAMRSEGSFNKAAACGTATNEWSPIPIPTHASAPTPTELEGDDLSITLPYPVARAKGETMADDAVEEATERKLRKIPKLVDLAVRGDFDQVTKICDQPDKLALAIRRHPRLQDKYGACVLGPDGWLRAVVWPQTTKHGRQREVGSSDLKIILALESAPASVSNLDQAQNTADSCCIACEAGTATSTLKRILLETPLMLVCKSLAYCGKQQSRLGQYKEGKAECVFNLEACQTKIDAIHSNLTRAVQAVFETREIWTRTPSRKLQVDFLFRFALVKCDGYLTLNTCDDSMMSRLVAQLLSNEAPLHVAIYASASRLAAAARANTGPMPSGQYVVMLTSKLPKTPR